MEYINTDNLKTIISNYQTLIKDNERLRSQLIVLKSHKGIDFNAIDDELNMHYDIVDTNTSKDDIIEQYKSLMKEIDKRYKDEQEFKKNDFIDFNKIDKEMKKCKIKNRDEKDYEPIRYIKENHKPISGFFGEINDSIKDDEGHNYYYYYDLYCNKYLNEILEKAKCKNLDELMNIETLNISYTNIRQLPYSMINLKELYCNFTDICRIPKTLISLKKLCCEKTKIRTIPDTLVNLEYLNCIKSEITKIPDTLVNLEYLNCDNTNMQKIPGTKLTYLSCKNTPLMEIHLDE